MMLVCTTPATGEIFSRMVVFACVPVLQSSWATGLVSAITTTLAKLAVAKFERFQVSTVSAVLVARSNSMNR